MALLAHVPQSPRVAFPIQGVAVTSLMVWGHSPPGLMTWSPGRGAEQSRWADRGAHSPLQKGPRLPFPSSCPRVILVGPGSPHRTLDMWPPSCGRADGQCPGPGGRAKGERAGESLREGWGPPGGGG